MTAPATVLIVDDELNNRRLLEVLLRPEGYATVSAANGQEALEAVSARGIDLIVLDVMMPGMDGYEVARRLKADPLTRSIPIIMVTALVDRQTRLAALSAGVEEFLTKPVDRAELWLRVRNLLRLKEYADLLQNQSAVLEQRVEERTADLQRFRLAMDATADAICLVSRSTMRFVEVNATAARMFGYTRDELLQLGPDEIGSASDGELRTSYDAVIAGEATNEFVELEVRRKDGSLFDAEVTRHARRSGDDWIVVCVIRDITERKVTEERLQHLAHFDALTGLPNRTLFYDTLAHSLELAAHRGWTQAVLFIDLDRFKNVNDTLGHTIGDELLVQVAQRLVQCVRLRDTVGRLGGDEFAVLVVLEQGPHGAHLIARKIREALRAPFDLDGHEVTVTASIGITVYPDDASDPAALIKFADTAMYRAKQAGRDTFQFFTAQMNIELLARVELEKALHEAIDKEQFVLHYQPKVQIDTGRIAGVEALLRWERPGFGLVSPNDFIPVLEETGMICEVGAWAIHAACRQIALWMSSDIGPVPVAVNVSGRQVVDGELGADVEAALRAHDVAPDLLELELTESSLMEDAHRTVATLRRLSARGVRLSLDDFGTGYSCLAYLRRFPINKLKIDIAFIRDVTSSADDAAMTLTIIRMAHSLKMDVVAEGVETAAQLAYLARHGCDQIQGYYFSRPLPLSDLEVLLREGARMRRLRGVIQPVRTTLLLVAHDVETLRALERLLGDDGYHLLTAPSAAEGLELLALHQVSVIVCEDNLSTHNGARFLDSVKELHPHTLRIVLADSSDAERVLDAVNRGAIYGFYSKPWNASALRGKVRDAARHRRLLDGDPLSGEVPADPSAHEVALDDQRTAPYAPLQRTSAAQDPAREAAAEPTRSP